MTEKTVVTQIRETKHKILRKIQAVFYKACSKIYQFTLFYERNNINKNQISRD